MGNLGDRIDKKKIERKADSNEKRKDIKKKDDDWKIKCSQLTRNTLTIKKWTYETSI